ncbi:MAG: helix-turn-helix domain-containing protein [Acidobacteria bacterium]|jgi:excisionase family DNA binding protein|nr:helix-turn-helix domain-containing protein [Acidobacteriota bacterium]
MANKKGKLLSVKDAAAALDLSEQRIKQLIYEGRLWAEKIGNQWIIVESDLEAVRDRQTGRPAKEKK